MRLSPYVRYGPRLISRLLEVSGKLWRRLTDGLASTLRLLNGDGQGRKEQKGRIYSAFGHTKGTAGLLQPECEKGNVHPSHEYSPTN